jgi:hypothetical protein
MAGGLISLIVSKLSKEGTAAKREEQGILFSSGLVAGDALVGVLIAFGIALSSGYRAFYESHEEVSIAGTLGPWLSLIAFLIMGLMLYRTTRIKDVKN